MDIVLYRQKNINICVINLVDLLVLYISYHKRIRMTSEGDY